MGKSLGKILVRTGGALHQQLLDQAHRDQRSLNEISVERLSTPSSIAGPANAPLRLALNSAEQLLGNDLIGMVFYGSRARNEGRLDSDWDILIVTTAKMTMSRELYRRRDSLVSQAIDSKFEINFAQLPASSATATGFWSEIALDGIVIYEHEFAISRHLARVRREIADGLIIRRHRHGQPYWIRREIA